MQTKNNIYTMTKYVTYIRVSTQKQGATGLGLDAQRKMCREFIERNHGEHAHEFMDVESGTHRDRKGLWDAIDYCKKNGCSLVIAKLDRLARDVEFTFRIINTGIDIHFTDMPTINTMVLGVFASVAQYERELCSSRTKSALAEKKRQGCKLGAKTDKWKASYEAKSDEQKAKEFAKRGATNTKRFLEGRDAQVFFKVLRTVFPDACVDDNVEHWRWGLINTKYENRTKILQLMRDYKDIDESKKTFAKWNFDMDATKLQVKLAAYIQSFRRSIFKV